MSLAWVMPRHGVVFCLAASLLAAGCSGGSPTPAVGGGANLAGAAAGRAGSYRVVSSFPKGSVLAQVPEGNMVVVKGRLFGIAHGGNSLSDGVIFSATPNERPTTWYRFGSQAGDGVTPNKDLVEVNGTIYGTTADGGKYGHGAVFSYVPASIPLQSVETVLYDFTGGTDGGSPAAGLTYVNGEFYGTTTQGGTNGKGGLFKLFDNFKKIEVLHQFGAMPDSSQVEAPLTWDGHQFLWGVSTEGGSNKGPSGSFPNGYGTIFRYLLDGHGGVYYDCDGDTMLAPREALVWTPIEGGKPNVFSVASGFDNGNGYIYGFVASLFTREKPVILHAFARSEGSSPSGGLFLNGTDLFGVTNVGPGDKAGGTIYRWNKDTAAFSIVHVFTGNMREPSSDGGNPASTLVQYAKELYGTTRGGGAEGTGTVWALSGY